MKIPRQMKIITTEIEELKPCTLYNSPYFKIVQERIWSDENRVELLIGSYEPLCKFNLSVNKISAREFASFFNEIADYLEGKDK